MMEPLHLDTIVAPVTPVGHGGLSVVRVSGPEAWAVAAQVFDRWPGRPQSHQATYGRFAHGDDGLALPFALGHGFTGDEAVEFSLHGSPASVDALLEACRRAGARDAEPGEFSLRAFLNGRLDLTQAEGVRETVEAETREQLKAANQLRGGSLSAAASALRTVLLEVLTEIEARVDFAEELGPLDRPQAAQKLEHVLNELSHLTEGADASRLLRRGLRVAILGRPNAGKSSLLNALLNVERAIVTPIAGTTRDLIEERLDVNGFPLVLIDTAGLRDTQDPVESLGVQRSRLAAAEADAVWYLYDASTGWTPEDEAAVAGIEKPVLIVRNKSDLAKGEHGVAVSATCRQGLGQLTEWVRDRFDGPTPTVPVNERHAKLLTECAEAVAEAKALIENDRPEDLASTAIQDAIQHLGQLTGETASPDMIHEIFSRFCLGK